MNDAGIQRLPPQAAPRAQTLNAGTDPTIIGGPRDTLRLDQEADVDAAAKAAEKMAITEFKENDPPQLLADFVGSGSGTRSGA